jgi:hypothetical protein
MEMASIIALQFAKCDAISEISATSAAVKRRPPLQRQHRHKDRHQHQHERDAGVPRAPMVADTGRNSFSLYLVLVKIGPDRGLMIGAEVTHNVG